MKFKRKNNVGMNNKKEIKVVRSRKEIRKQQRKEKKAKKNEFFQRQKFHSDKVADVDVRERGCDDGATKQKIKQQHMDSRDAPSRVGLAELQQSARNKKKQQEDRRKLLYQKKRVQQLKAANEEEDRVIKKLAKQLKLNKRKRNSVPKSFSFDGLDYLLEVCEEEGRQNAISVEKNFRESSDSEFEEDLALATGKVAERTKLSSLSETQDIVHTTVDSDCSEGNSESGGSDSGIEAERATESCSDDFVSDSEADEHVNSVNLKKKRTIEVVKNADNQQNSDVDLTTSVSVLQNPDKVKQHKKVRVRGKLVDGVSVVTQKVISKRRLTSWADNDEDDDHGEGVNQQKNITKHKSRKRRNVTDAHASKDVDKKKKCVTFEDDDLSGLSEEEEAAGSGSGEDVWEDIYGRTRDRKGNILHEEAQGKYIPPHLRVQASDRDAKKQQQLLRLRKQMKGLLNRLAESNMNSIAVQIEELYMSNSRNDMNETLTELVLESVIAPVLTPDRLVMEHVMLVAILHANVGSEVGAHVMQVLVTKFDLLNTQHQEVEKKELDNVVLTLSHLYNFRVFHCLLMFDILEKLVERFHEKEIELILVVLRSVGFSLRKDDPSALKTFILQVQKKASTDAHSSSSSRVNFMLDILLAIKNNNMSKIPNYDTSHSEHLKKLLKGFLRKGNYVTELKISLDDLLKAEERGRWWVVGSAWTGVLPGEVRAEELSNVSSASSRPTTQYSQQLLELARNQRLNTDVRRNIFCILMTAEDYLDAFEKLLHLGLKNQQEREIIYVILHCCMQEKKFNPYYGFLAQKFCNFDRRYQMTLQFSLWDKFKEMQTFNQQQTTNLAKLLAHLLLERGLPISVLKVVEFMNVDKRMVRFVRQTLLGVLLSPSEEASLQVFQRVAQSAKLRMFCESLRLFVHHFLLRNTAALLEGDVELLTRRARQADALLTAPQYTL